MIRLSSSVLSASCKLIAIAKKNCINVAELKDEKIDGVVASDVLDVSRSCGWIIVTEDGNIQINERVETWCSYSISVGRMMLYEYILKVKPSWMYLLTRGRRESVRFIDMDSRICFEQLLLMENPVSEDAAKWWINIICKLYEARSDMNAVTGLNGEQLTIEYELKRVGKVPIWKSIDSSLVGYDIESSVSKEVPECLKIEVKSSIESIDTAIMHISYNEWMVARTSKNYKFYLWILSGIKKVAILDKNDIEPHISICAGMGTWSSTKIPYSAFSDLFGEYT